MKCPLILGLSYQVILYSQRRILLANCPHEAETVNSQVRPVTLWCGRSFHVMVGWVASLVRVADSYQPHWNLHVHVHCFLNTLPLCVLLPIFISPPNMGS